MSNSAIFFRWQLKRGMRSRSHVAATALNEPFPSLGPFVGQSGNA
jgi:hypothetical protein